MEEISSKREWAIVTGASSGIGAEYARALARRGYRVLAVARREERLRALADELRPEGGIVEPFVADLKTAGGVKDLVRRAGELAEISLLVNCAGYADYGSFLELTANQAKDLLRVNTLALVELTHHVGARMVQRSRGTIVNVASAMGFQPMPYFSVYAASKAFVLSFSEGLAAELAGTGVYVQALCPGGTRTEFNATAGADHVLHRFTRGTAADVVAVSLRAADRRRVVVTAGLPARLMALLARVTPRAINRWVTRLIMRPRPALPAVGGAA